MRKYNGNVGYYRDNKTEKEIDIIGNSVKENLYIEVKCAFDFSRLISSADGGIYSH